MTTCLETFGKEKFCSFPHRHGEATGKPETPKTRQVGAPKWAFRARLPPSLTLCSFRIDVSYEFSGTWNYAISKSMFRARLPSIFSTSNKMPRLPRNLHLVATLPMRFAKNTQHDTSKVLHLPRKMTMDTSKVLRLPWKLQRISWKRRKSTAPATQNHFRHVTKHVWMSRSATPATRNEATGHLKTSKKHPFCRTYHRHGHTALTRTVADGCIRLRTVANVKETSSEHTLSPQDPQSEMGTLATHSGKSLYTEELLHTDGFTQIFTTKPLHRGTFTQRNLYAQTRLHTVVFTHRSFCTEKSLPIFHHV